MAEADNKWELQEVKLSGTRQEISTKIKQEVPEENKTRHTTAKHVSNTAGYDRCVLLIQFYLSIGFTFILKVMVLKENIDKNTILNCNFHLVMLSLNKTK